MKKALLIAAICSVLLIWVVSQFQGANETEDAEFGNPSQSNIRMEDLQAQSLVQLQIERALITKSPITERSVSLGIKLVFCGPQRIAGNIVSDDSGILYPIAEGDSLIRENLIVLPPGRYRIELSDGATASPKELFLGNGTESVICRSSWGGELSLRDGLKPTAGVFGFFRAAGVPWQPLGVSNDSGAFEDLPPEGKYDLALLKVNEFLVFKRAVELRGGKELVLQIPIDELTQSEVQLVKGDVPFGPRNAKLVFEDIVIKEFSSTGSLTIGTVDDESRWNSCVAKSDGYLDALFFNQGKDGSRDKFVIPLEAAMKQPVRVLDGDTDRSVAGAHILLMSLGKYERYYLRYEMTSGNDGEFFLPLGLDSDDAIVAWKAEEGYAMALVSEVQMDGTIQLAPSPGCQVSALNAQGEFISFSGVQATSFWGESVGISLDLDGNLLISEPVGVSSIHLTFPSGEERVIKRDQLYKGKASMGLPKIFQAVSGELTHAETTLWEVNGQVLGRLPSSREDDLLELILRPTGMVEKNSQKWPQARGSRPSTLDAWVWADQNVQYRTFIKRNQEFSLEGVPAGDYEMFLRNIAQSGGRIRIEEPRVINVPTVTNLSISLEETILLDWTVSPQTQGGVIRSAHLEYSEFGYFGPNSSRFKSFSGGRILQRLNSSIERIRIVAPGYVPKEMRLEPNDKGIDLRVISLVREVPMKIILEVSNSTDEGVVIIADSGWFNDEFGFMAPIDRDFLNFGSAMELDYWGPFPGSDVYLSLKDSFDGELSPRRVKFLPGSTVVVLVSGSTGPSLTD